MFLFSNFILEDIAKPVYSVHKNEINFSVKYDVESCALNFNKYNSYYKHVRAHHNDIHSLKSIEGITSTGILLNKSKSCSMEILNSTNPKRVMIRMADKL